MTSNLWNDDTQGQALPPVQQAAQQVQQGQPVQQPVQQAAPPVVTAGDDPTVCVLPNCIILYPALFKARVARGSGPDAVPMYGCDVLLPLDFDYSDIHRAALAAAVAKFGPQAEQMIAGGVLKNPLRSQLERHLKGKAGYSSDPRAKFLRAKSEYRPGVVDQNVKPVLDPERVFGGLYCNVQVNAFAWNHPTGGPGISFGLQNVQIVKEGPRLGTGNPAPTSVFRPLQRQDGAQQEANMKSLWG